MPNLKKFVALSLGAVCLLSSCNHTVNAEGAKKFIKENYTAEKKSTFKGIEKIAYTFKATAKKDTNETKTLVKDLTKLKAALANYTKLSDGATSFNCDLTSGITFDYYSEVASTQLNETVVDDFEKVEGAKNTYTISRDEISIWNHASDNYDFGEGYKFKGTFDNTNIYNNAGFARYNLTTTDFDVADDNIYFKTSETFTVTFKK